jgi:hypothetical protein
MGQTVVTMTSNGRLMKPQFLDENKKLQDWTSSNTTIGSSSIKKHNGLTHFERFDEPNRSHDWTKLHPKSAALEYLDLDLGSWQETANSTSKKRTFQGLSGDVSTLPTYDAIPTGSTALCLDTGDIYFYNAQDKTWYLQ